MDANVKSRSKTGPSVRQTVTMPADLAIAVRRVAKERHLTISSALVSLAERGIEAEQADRENLTTSYERFMADSDRSSNGQAGQDLVRAVFGSDAIAEDPIR